MALSAITPSPIPYPAAKAKKHKLPCQEWCRIVEMYRAAARDFNDSVGALPLAPGREFDLVWQRVERTRKTCDDARSALLAHEHEHNCQARKERS